MSDLVAIANSKDLAVLTLDRPPVNAIDISLAMGELSLLPAVREAAPETLIVADGTSCRHQIADGAGRRAVHVAQVLAGALREKI